jgi:hypothetical protein
MAKATYAGSAMGGRTPATRLKKIRDLVIEAEAEAAALFLRVDGERRERMRRVMEFLVTVRNEIDGAQKRGPDTT